ncbi:MAG: siphovirus Gp157 family protein [Chloroflexi bacterium]|nr:siphovirus Gp157 family protein [Chloroflexota bacterium]
MAPRATARELARNMSLFEIDEALAALVESAQDEAAANDGELSESLRTALSDYVEAFGEKVDRIAQYVKAQESFAELAKEEEERLHARRRSAENRVKGVKSFLSFWMLSRGLKHLKGRLNTITLSKNSADTLIIDEQAAIPDRYHKVTVQMSWDEWTFVLNCLAEGPLRERLARIEETQRELNRPHLQEAIADGVVLSGVRLVRGHHVRMS